MNERFSNLLLIIFIDSFPPLSWDKKYVLAMAGQGHHPTCSVYEDEKKDVYFLAGTNEDAKKELARGCVRKSAHRITRMAMS